MFNTKINLFKKKYNILILNSKWEILEKNIKLEFLPRQNEYIWNGLKYYQVLNLVHNIEKIHQISIIVEEMTNPQSTINQIVK